MRVFALIISFLISFAPSNSYALDITAIRDACEVPSNDVCSLELFKAARLEMRKMGREEDLNEHSGAPALIRAYLDAARKKTESPSYTGERNLRLKDIYYAEQFVDAHIADFFAQMGAVTAYRALDVDPELANSMVTDIMDLWERLLVWLKRKGSAFPENYEFQVGLVFPSLPFQIAEYQLGEGFLPGAVDTLNRYNAKSSVLSSLLGPQGLEQQPRYAKYSAAIISAVRIANRAATEGQYDVADLSRFIDEFASTPDEDIFPWHSKSQLSVYLVDAAIGVDRIEALWNAAFLLDSAEWTARILVQISDEDSMPVSGADMAAFAENHGEELGEMRLSFIGALVRAGRFQDAKNLWYDLTDLDSAADILVNLYHAGSDVVLPAEVVIFLAEHAANLSELSKKNLIFALADAGQYRDVLKIVETSRDAFVPEYGILALLKASPDLVNQRQIEDLIRSDDTEINIKASEIADALLQAGRFEDAKHLVLNLANNDTAVDLLADLIEVNSPGVSAEELDAFLSARYLDLDPPWFGGLKLLEALAGAGRYSEARDITESLNDPDKAISALTTLVEIAPEHISPAFVRALVLKHRHKWLESEEPLWSASPRQGLFNALVTAGRREEALGLIEDIDGRKYVLFLTEAISRDPEIFPAEKILELVDAWRDDLRSTDIFQLAEALISGGHEAEARALISRLSGQSPREGNWEGSALEDLIEVMILEAACSQNFFENQTPNLFEHMLPELLLLIENEKQPCGRVWMLLSAAGQR